MFTFDLHSLLVHLPNDVSQSVRSAKSGTLMLDRLAHAALRDEQVAISIATYAPPLLVDLVCRVLSANDIAIEKPDFHTEASFHIDSVLRVALAALWLPHASQTLP